MESRNNIILREPKIFAIFLTSFFLLILSAIFAALDPKGLKWILITIVLSEFSACIFFPILVGYFYDKLKEKEEGEIIWRVFKEFSDGGILRVYKDREENESSENALIDLKKAFENHQYGEVKMVGVTLRVFLNELGPFYENMKRICNLHKNNKQVSIRTLISHPDSPEVQNRAKLETPEMADDPLIKTYIRHSIASIENFTKLYGDNSIKHKLYYPAPYCTAVIFPNKCYFSPNLLSPDPPVKLPMIIFSKDSHGYNKLNEYFNYLWEQNEPEKKIIEENK